MSKTQISPLSSILRKAVPVKKKLRKSISFRDDVGAELVECFEVPKIVYDEDVKPDDGRPKYEATKGKYISMHKPPEPVYNWNSVELVAPDRIDVSPVSQSFLVEQRRLVELGIISMPLFGTFDVVDDSQLHIDAAMRAYHNIPIQIPLGVVKTCVPASQIRDLPLPGRKAPPPSASDEFARLAESFMQVGEVEQPVEPQKNVYSQEHDASTQREYIYTAQMGESSGSQYVSTSSESVHEVSPLPAQQPPQPPPPQQQANKMTDLFSLMEQLKQKGLMPTSKPAADMPSNNNNYDPVYPVQINNTAMPGSVSNEMKELSCGSDGERRRPRHCQPGYLINEHCTYFLFKDGGCVRGDKCRFLHDEREREKRLLEKAALQAQYQRGGYSDDPRRFSREGSPHSGSPRNSGHYDRRSESWRRAPPSHPVHMQPPMPANRPNSEEHRFRGPGMPRVMNHHPAMPYRSSSAHYGGPRMRISSPTRLPPDPRFSRSPPRIMDRPGPSRGLPRSPEFRQDLRREPPRMQAYRSPDGPRPGVIIGHHHQDPHLNRQPALPHPQFSQPPPSTQPSVYRAVPHNYNHMQ